MADDPPSTGVELFALHGDRIIFFRPRDHDPVTKRVWHGQVVSGQLARGPDGRDVFVPVKETGRYDPIARGCCRDEVQPEHHLGR